MGKRVVTTQGDGACAFRFEYFSVLTIRANFRPTALQRPTCASALLAQLVWFVSPRQWNVIGLDIGLLIFRSVLSQHLHDTGIHDMMA